ncbi:MAG: hypothetical protein N2036_10510, partial [Bryobacteraceae bacterium]|nr:hypothetical protein [Bryobacteraceae bacterium]
KARLPEAYCWLLVPEQPEPQGEAEWKAIRLSGIEPLAVRASKRLRSEELLVTALAGTSLRFQLDRVPLWRGDHVEVRQLAEDFARYLYLPRLRNKDVLVGAIQDGLALLTWEQETFAYADSYDEKTGRYRGLRAGAQAGGAAIESGLLVRPEAAARQMREAAAAPKENTSSATMTAGAGTADLRMGRPAGGPDEAPNTAPPTPKVRRFHGSAKLDPTRVGRDAGRIAEEVIAHLAGLPGAELEVTLEIQASLPEGVPDNVVRTVTENCHTLKFRSHGFERE